MEILRPEHVEKYLKSLSNKEIWEKINAEVEFSTNSWSVFNEISFDFQLLEKVLNRCGISDGRSYRFRPEIKQWFLNVILEKSELQHNKETKRGYDEFTAILPIYDEKHGCNFKIFIDKDDLHEYNASVLRYLKIEKEY